MSIFQPWSGKSEVPIPAFVSSPGRTVLYVGGEVFRVVCDVRDNLLKDLGMLSWVSKNTSRDSPEQIRAVVADLVINSPQWRLLLSAPFGVSAPLSITPSTRSPVPSLPPFPPPLQSPSGCCCVESVVSFGGLCTVHETQEAHYRWQL